jgi:cyclophilin family peptidyl-prolyl cis-trans isomerase
MPKTADKRAQARHEARVQRAHQTAPERPVVRKVPFAKQRAKRPTGFLGFLQRYQWATTIFFVALVGLSVYFLYAQKLGPFAPTPPPCVAPTTRHWDSAPAATINPTKQYAATVKTAKGNIVIALDAKNTPITTNNFVFLSQHNYFCGTYFWRVETPGQPSPINPSGGPSPLSLIQGGSVAKDGQDASDTPGYTIPDELSTAQNGYGPGTVAMANTGNPNTGSAQFFINIGDNTKYFSKTYTVFGHVTSGMDVVKKSAAGDAMQGSTITVK